MREGEREDRLLFLHPVGLDARCVQFLDLPGVRAATFPGHGDRRRSRPGLSLGDMADEVAGWTTGSMDLVGTSLGGMVALHVALDHPERVRSLVLSCTTPYGSPDVMNARAEETEARGAQGMVAQTLARWFRRETLARVPAAPAVEYARRCLTDMDTGALADTWRAIARHDVRVRLAEIGVPTTCIAGLHDVSTPPAVVAELADRIPGARLDRLDAAHMAHLEQPQHFAEIVRRHLARVREQVHR